MSLKDFAVFVLVGAAIFGIIHTWSAAIGAWLAQAFKKLVGWTETESGALVGDIEHVFTKKPATVAAPAPAPAGAPSLTVHVNTGTQTGTAAPAPAPLKPTTPSVSSLAAPPAGVIVDPSDATKVIGPFGPGNGALSIPRIFSGEDTMFGVPAQRGSYALYAASDAALAGLPANGAAWAAAYAAGVSAPLAAAFIAQFNAANAPVVTS